MMKLLFGSSNAGKLIEIKEALHECALEIIAPSKMGITDVPEEHGSSYEENALQKARFYFGRSKLPTLADDSGIIVHALKDELGIHTRRWGAGKNATDQEWIDFFLKRMEREENRKAKFVCVLAFIDNNGKEHVFEGFCDGIITPSLEADYLPGLPISACFRPDGFDRVYSALSLEEKNRISHRGRAIAVFRDYLTLDSTRSQNNNG